MSYDIVRSIKITDGRVFIKAAPSNVYPRDYEEFECKSLTKILQEEGQEKLDIRILREFESGNFHGSIGKYTRQLSILRHLPGYTDFNWRCPSSDFERISVNRKTAAFDELIRTAMSMKAPREKYIIKKDGYGTTVYLKSARRRTRWIGDRSEAKIFRYLDDAEFLKECYTNADNWEIEKIA